MILDISKQKDDVNIYLQWEIKSMLKCLSAPFYYIPHWETKKSKEYLKLTTRESREISMA
jgi:hypothetical protein